MWYGAPSCLLSKAHHGERHGAKFGVLKDVAHTKTWLERHCGRV